MKERRATRREKIQDILHRYTIRYIDGHPDILQQTDALSLSLKLHLDRANVSRELNRMHSEGLLIKFMGRPTYYLDRSALTSAYSQAFFPSNIEKDKSIWDYLPADESAAHPASRPAGPDVNVPIGIHGSLREAFSRGCAAIMYPPHGLHMLVTGPVGTGKLHFVKYLHRYAVENHMLAENAPLVIFDCREYLDAPHDLIVQLFGKGKGASERATKGLLEKSSGGILCLDGIQSMDVSIQKRIVKLIKNNRFSRVGESGAGRSTSAFIIAIASAEIDSPEISLIAQSFPVTISIPALDERPKQELLEYITLFFQRESTRIGRTISVDTDVLTCLLESHYPGNNVEIAGRVQALCASAYRDYVTSKSRSDSIHIRSVYFTDEQLRNVSDQRECARVIRNFFQGSPKTQITFLPSIPFTFHYHEENEKDVTARKAGIPAYFLFHGRNIAESFCSYYQKILPDLRLGAASYTESTSLEEIYQKIVSFAQANDRGNGILIIADRDPLNYLHEKLSGQCHIPAVTITNPRIADILSILQTAAKADDSVYNVSFKYYTGKAAAYGNIFLDRVIEEVLSPSLTFLNPQRAANLLLDALNKTLIDLSMPFNEAAAVKLLLQSSHMIEQSIQKQTHPYPHLKGFVSHHIKVINVLEKYLSPVWESFGVSVTTDELAALAETLLS